MMKPPLEIKTPDEVKDYGIDWTSYLEDATIATSNWVITSALGSPDLTIESEDTEGLTSLVRVAGGEAGRDYTLQNTITTSAGETLVQAIEVRVRSAENAAGIY